jgi:sec-independent protein translocase protein TatC
MSPEDKNARSSRETASNDELVQPDEQTGAASADTVEDPLETSNVRPDDANYTVEDPYSYEDGYPYGAEPYSGTPTALEPVTAAAPAEPPPPSPPKKEEEAEDDGDEDGMLRMSFLEHLEELRKRILHALIGLFVAFIVSLTFSERLWGIVQEPAAAALRNLGYKDMGLVFTSPMESFSIIWMKLPLLVSVFIASPWILYQVWAFVAPGLYKRERRWAAPFILTSAGLFILGGLFAYFVAFRFGLTFLLGIGQNVGVRPMVTISEYFDIFVNVILGIGVVFELPVLIFFLTLLRIASPRFLLANARYAVLGIVVVAAIITPTPDIFNLVIFSVPMVFLYFIGIFASYLLVLSREGRRFPWGKVLLVLLLALVLAGAGVWIAVARYGYQLGSAWPYLTKP